MSTCKKILIVEDDEDIRVQVVAALEDEGYTTMVAENGQVALDLLLSLSDDELPGCMILDIMMPVMDGQKLLEIIDREHPRLRAVKALVATAKGSPVNPEKIPHAVQRIQKPFRLDELFGAVEEHCGKPAK